MRPIDFQISSRNGAPRLRSGSCCGQDPSGKEGSTILILAPVSKTYSGKNFLSSDQRDILSAQRRSMIATEKQRATVTSSSSTRVGFRISKLGLPKIHESLDSRRNRCHPPGSKPAAPRTTPLPPVIARDDSTHERIEKRHGERRISVARAPHHAFGDELTPGWSQ